MSYRTVNLTQQHALAVAIACGSSVAQFSKSRDIPISTCYAWLARPHLRALIAGYQADITTASIALAARNLASQVNTKRAWPRRSQAELTRTIQKRPAAKEPA